MTWYGSTPLRVFFRTNCRWQSRLERRLKQGERDVRPRCVVRARIRFFLTTGSSGNPDRDATSHGSCNRLIVMDVGDTERYRHRRTVGAANGAASDVASCCRLTMRSISASRSVSTPKHRCPLANHIPPKALQSELRPHHRSGQRSRRNGQGFSAALGCVDSTPRDSRGAGGWRVRARPHGRALTPYAPDEYDRAGRRGDPMGPSGTPLTSWRDARRHRGAGRSEGSRETRRNKKGVVTA